MFMLWFSTEPYPHNTIFVRPLKFVGQKYFCLCLVQDYENIRSFSLFKAWSMS